MYNNIKNIRLIIVIRIFSTSLAIVHLIGRGREGLWFFVSFSIFFSDNTRVRIFIFFVAQSANFFFQNLTLDFMTKTLNQIIFFFLHQNQNIFFSNFGNQNIFFRKSHNALPPSPPFEVKWSVPTIISKIDFIFMTTCLTFVPKLFKLIN